MTRETQGPSQDDIERALKKALKATIDELGKEIEFGLSERAIVHRFAVALERDGFFDGWHVDCEYNRHGHDPKRLLLESTVSDACSEMCSLVLPDLVIHRRGSLGPNLVVIEAKRSGNSPNKRDAQKLLAYVHELRYRHAYFVSFAGNGCVKRVDSDVMDAGAI